MEFKKMCIMSGMKKRAANEYADLVNYANQTDKLLMLYYMWGMIDGKAAAIELARREEQRERGYAK